MNQQGALGGVTTSSSGGLMEWEHQHTPLKPTVDNNVSLSDPHGHPLHGAPAGTSLHTILTILLIFNSPFVIL